MKKRIAVVSELYGTSRQGGENQAMYNLYSALKNQGYNVHFYSYGNGKKIHNILPRYLKILPIFRDLFISPIFTYALLRKIRNKYDLIILSSSTSTFLSKFDNVIYWVHACRTMKTEKFINQKKYPLLFNFLSFKLFYMLEKNSFNNAKKVYVISDSIRLYLKRNLEVSVSVSLLPNFVDSEIFRPLHIKKVYDYIFVGRGTYQKGFDQLIQIAQDNPRLRFLAIINILDASFIDIPANINIRYNVPNKDLATFYCSAKSFILPSKDEEQPLTILEAMSCGLNILGTKEALKEYLPIKKSYFGLYTLTNKKIPRINFQKYLAGEIE